MRTCFLLLAILCCQAAVRGMEVSADRPSVLHTLTHDPEAKCLDGTPGAYYFRPSPANSTDSDKWLIYLMGGGVCTGKENCYQRSLTRLGSSALWPHLSQNNPQGPLSTNCTINPDFCNYNHVHVIYCDGMIYTGNQNNVVMYGNHTLYYRGSRIWKGVIDHLAMTTSFSSASTVLLTGCSAGGLATFLHGDQIAARIRSHVTGLKKIRSMPISGFFLRQPNADYLPVLEMLTSELIASCNGTDQLNGLCRDRVTQSASDVCTFPEFVFSGSTLPTFALNSKTDAWQVMCTLLGAPTATGFGCGSVQPTASCLGNGSPTAAFNNCTVQQMLPILWYQDTFLNRVWAVDGFHRPGSGSFISSCFTHCEASEDYYWYNLAIDGVTMQQAVSRWWNDENPATSSANHTYIDCARPYAAPYNCNPTCHPPAGTTTSQPVPHDWLF